jgi:hypothetical protein
MKKWAMLLLATAVIFSCSGRDRPAWIFAVNAYPRAVSLMVGDEPGPAFLAADLPPGAVSATEKVRTAGPFPVYYRPANLETWQRLPESLGKAACVFRPGTVTVLVVDARGFIRLETLVADARPGAALSFLNATPGLVSSVELFAPDDASSPVWRAYNLVSGAATRFRSLPPGAYRLQARFALRPAGADPRTAQPAPLEAVIRCPDPAYWLIYCFMKDGVPAFEQRLLDLGGGGRSAF